MTLFESTSSGYCEHGRQNGQCPFCPRPEARTSDPVTSHAAAASLDHRLKDQHHLMLYHLMTHGPLTDDQLAQAAVDQGWTGRTETARRWVRTLRERHGLIVPALDDDGLQLEQENESGRMALAWEAKTWG